MRYQPPSKVLASVLCAGMLVLGTATTAPQPAQAQEMPPSFAPVVKDLLPAVVNISTTKTVEQDGPFAELPENHPLRQFFDRFGGGERPQRQLRSLGSGFIIDESGYIVTNNHVIKDADKVSVILNDDTTLDAKVVGADPKTDVALLKVDTDHKLSHVEWGDSDTAKVGDWMLAIGNPFGLGGTVTAGIISARGRAINAGPYSRFIQTDTAINQGNSGGPLFNTQGKVIGINSAILSPSGGNVGVGFALPASVAQPIIEELRETGTVTRGWLGVSVQPLTGDLASGLNIPQNKGALIGDVTAEGPAAKAGLKSGDVILEFNGERVDDARGLAWLTAQSDPGETVKLTIWRDGERISREAKLGELGNHATGSDSESASAMAKTTAQAMGVTLASAKPRVLERFDLPHKTQGAVVTGVARGGPAAARGIRPGDLIRQIGQHAVATPKDVYKTVSSVLDQGADGVVVLVQRGSQTQFVAVPLVNPSTG